MMWTAKREREPGYGEDNLVIMDGDRIVMELHECQYYPSVVMPSDEDVELICKAVNNLKEGRG